MSGEQSELAYAVIQVETAFLAVSSLDDTRMNGKERRMAERLKNAAQAFMDLASEKD